MSTKKSSSLTNFINFLIVTPLVSGSTLFLLGLSLVLLAYFTHIQEILYIASFSLLIGLGLLFVSMKDDLSELVDSSLILYTAIVAVLVLYFTQRLALPNFFFSVADASDYFLAGVSSVLNGNDIGFFLPLTASISATGFMLFGYEYSLLIMVILYSVSIPLSYLLLRKLELSSLLSFMMTIVITLSPLSIWFSKTSFSEPMWQSLLLVLMLFSYHILHKKNIEFKTFVVITLVLVLASFSRGEAVLLYGMIIFLAIYHYWKFNDLTSALIIISTLIFLSISMYFLLDIRSHYLLDWQFSRILPHATSSQLMTIIYVITSMAVAMLFVLHLLKKSFSRLNLPLVLVLLTIAFKLIATAYFSQKKHIEFLDLLILNEYSFAINNFGLIITLLIACGLVLLYIKASDGHEMSLILVVTYTLFSLPFTMQAATFYDEHMFFLYWSRYYFSIFMMIHLLSAGLMIKLIYDKLNVILPAVRYKEVLVSTLILVGLIFSMNGKLHHIVTNDRYLMNSEKLFLWISKKVEKNSLSVVYPTDITYGNYDVKQLMKRGLKVTNVHVNQYRKIKAEAFNKKITLPDKMYKSKFLMCFSKAECEFTNPNLTLVETLNLPISWREHKGSIDTSAKKTIDLNVHLYKIQ